LIDPEVIKRTSNRVDVIEKAFNDNLNIKTERLSPFTFKFEHGIKTSHVTDMNYVQQNILSIIKKAGLPELNEFLSKALFSDIKFHIDEIDRGIKYTSNIKEAMASLPDDLLSDIYYEYDVDIQKLFGLKRFDLEDFDSVNLIDYLDDLKFNIKEYNSIDGEIIRKEVKKAIINNKMAVKYPVLLKNLKEMKPQHIKPFIN